MDQRTDDVRFQDRVIVLDHDPVGALEVRPAIAQHVDLVFGDPADLALPQRDTAETLRQLAESPVGDQTQLAVIFARRSGHHGFVEQDLAGLEDRLGQLQDQTRHASQVEVVAVQLANDAGQRQREAGDRALFGSHARNDAALLVGMRDRTRQLVVQRSVLFDQVPLAAAPGEQGEKRGDDRHRGAGQCRVGLGELPDRFQQRHGLVPRARP